MAEVVKNPWPRRIIIAACGVLVFVLIAVIALWLWIRSDAGRSFVETMVEDMEFAGQGVDLEGLDGSLLDAFTVDEIRLTGQDGTWLVARDVMIDWSPRDILSKTLTIKSIRVGDLDVLDRPVLIPGESNGDPRITTFDVRRFALPDVTVSEALIRREVALSANGSVRHSPDGGSAILSARSDQGDRVDADLDWSPLLVLSGTADVEGSEGGLIARLLKLDAAQGVSAQIRTDDSETQLVAQTDGVSFADLLITRRQSDVSVKGTLNPARLPVLEQVVPFLGGQVSLDATWPLDEAAEASLFLQAPLLVLTATGRQQDDDIIVDSLSLEAKDPLRGFDLNGLSIGSLHATGQASLSNIYSFDGQVDARNIAYRDYRVDELSGPAVFRVQDSQISFDLGLTGQASETAAKRADGARLSLTGTYERDAGQVALSRANIRLPGLGFSGRGQLGFDDPSKTALNGRYQIDTAIFRDGPAAQLEGQASLNQTASGSFIELTGQARNITGLADAIKPLMAEPVDYRAQLRLDGSVVRVPQLKIGNSLFGATGTARWEDGQLSAALDYQTDRYEHAAVSAQMIAGQARIEGPPRALRFDTELGIQTLETSALTLSDARIDASGTYEAGIITASGTLTAQSEQGPVSASGTVLQDGASWSVTELDGTLGDLQSSGTISGIGGDLASLRADLTLSGSSSLVPAESVEGRILLGDSQVDLDVVLSDVAVGQVQNGHVHLVAKGPRAAVNYVIDGTGLTIINDLERPLTLEASGLADLSADAITAQADFDLGVGTQSLAGDVQIHQREEGWSATVEAAGLGGQIEAALDPTDGGGLRFDLQTVSVPALARMLGRPATEGTVSGSGRFLFVGDRLQGQAALTLNDLRSPISQSAPISILTRVQLANERLTATLEAVEGGLSGQARIEGRVETGRGAPYLQWPPATPLQGLADFKGEIGPLVEIFLPPRTDVAGRVDSNVSFTVPFSRQDIVGRVALSEGQFEQGALGLRLKNITIVAELNGEMVSIPTLSADGVDGGRLSGSGQMGIGAGMGTVDIQTTKLRVIDRGEGQAEVSGELTLSRTEQLLRLAGELRVTDADINIARLPEPGLPTLDVSFGGDMEAEPTQSFASATTEFDVAVLSNNRIKVRGRGLNANMGLSASVTGSFDDPVVTGEMTIDRGRFDFLGKRFELRDSSVLLRDDILQSILALEAIRSTSDLTAVVQVTGTLERPEIALTSEPTLPEDEVMSRVLFGRSPTQLSAIETARLAAALTQLSGGSGFDLFGSLEDAVGLDTLEVGQSEAGQTQLTTGKYLSDDVYLEVRTAAEGTPGIAVEWQVRNNISLEAETQPNERQRLSVQWKKDFD